VPLPEPVPGLVIGYAYLWWDEARRGRQEGIKDRPCVVVLAVQQTNGVHIVTVAPISHIPPRDPREGIELPAETKRRLGLDDQKSWVIANELNRFPWPGPDLRPVSRSRPTAFAYGALPRKLMLQVIQRLSEQHQANRIRTVKRDQ
jgi:hypothetical protein